MQRITFNQWQDHLAKELSKDYKKLYYTAKFDNKKEVKKALITKN
jgi:hypothetical protein